MANPTVGHCALTDLCHNFWQDTRQGKIVHPKRYCSPRCKKAGKDRAREQRGRTRTATYTCPDCNRNHTTKRLSRLPNGATYLCPSCRAVAAAPPPFEGRWRQLRINARQRPTSGRWDHNSNDLWATPIHWYTCIVCHRLGFTHRANQKYCSTTCTNRFKRQRDKRRQGRSKNAASRRRKIARLIERHGTTCYLCGHQLPNNHNGDHIHLDHIIPRSHPASTNRDTNLRPVHAQCNLDRSNQPLTTTQAGRL